MPRLHRPNLSVLAILAAVSLAGCKKQDEDSRTKTPVVVLAPVVCANTLTNAFTGVVTARVQSDLGFRVSGKVIERLVDRGQQVRAGDPLMRIDPTDLEQAVTAQAANVASAKANLMQAEADSVRNRKLVASGSVSEQAFIDSNAAADVGRGALAAAAAQLRVAQDNLAYATLYADSGGTIVDTLVEPGQVVAAGQVVVQLAHAGPREGRIDLPENVRPRLGSTADASLYADGETHEHAVLRELSDSADPETRTFAARYVLQGAAAQAPLGATVTIYLPNLADAPELAAPVGALSDDGVVTGVWLYNSHTSSVSLSPVKVIAISNETVSFTSSLHPGQQIVALGVNLLHNNENVRIAPAQGTAP